MKILLLLILSITFSTLASAKNYGFIKTSGTKQGIFKGESVAKGHEQSSEILGFNFEVLSPRDPSSGLPSGKRQLKPITILKDWGASSNQYYSAVATNESLKEVRIEFFSFNGKDQEVLERSIVLTNAAVIDVKDVTTSVNGDLQDAESITFTYQKITITDKSGTVYTDDLNTQN